jgi:hypothetical protein
MVFGIIPECRSASLRNWRSASPESPLDRKEQNEIDKLIRAPFSLPGMKGPALLLGATSGLQIGQERKLKFPEGLTETQRQELQKQLGGCFGPHVGSYHNKIFKRFMYATRLPIVIFVTADKIDCEIDVGKCHFILDCTFTWEEFCKVHPVAFCVGGSSDQMPQCAQMFRDLGFEIRNGQTYTPITSFMTRNRAFIDQFEAQLGESRSVAAGM